MSEPLILGDIADENALASFAAVFAEALPTKLLVGLSGPLAAGKTTFTRYVLRALGFAGSVKSPTFTLVETYDCKRLTVHHFDLYRLAQAGELYYLGFDDFVAAEAVCLIEWPERGGALMQELDVLLSLEPISDLGRRLQLEARTAQGQKLVKAVDEYKFFK